MLLKKNTLKLKMSFSQCPISPTRMWNEVQRLYTEGTAAEIATAGLAVSGIAVVAFIWRWGK